MTPSSRAQRSDPTGRRLAGPVARAVLAAAAGLGAVGAPGAAPAATLELQQVAAGLSRPVAIAHAGDGSGRLFIALQRGPIRVHDGAALLPQPFLDLSGLVTCCGERGLLGLAFDPAYATNGRFYVNYTNAAGNTVVARYLRSAADPLVADPASATVILRVRQPFPNHNGGQLAFGPDGMLYVGLGDGGGAGDPGNRAQRLGTLLGKILRIDVSGDAYAIPPDNPFVGRRRARQEIWARGLRNPWRFSFDRETGQLFIADVGQGSREEVDFERAGSRGGRNYGWRRMEGSICHDPPAGCGGGRLRRPILEYRHAAGRCAITGGYRYRGGDVPALAGNYLFADFCTGTVWGGRFVPGRGWRRRVLLRSAMRVSTFGEDERGEVYLADYATGDLHRIVGLLP